MQNYLTDISNILVVGCGGAGLSAAIEAKINGLNVKVIGKRNQNDSHTVLAAGGVNASFGNVDPNDNWQYHFIDTYLDGYGIGDPELIKILVKKAPNSVSEVDSWGANFAKLKSGKLDQRFFGAHKYRRTCYSGDYTGQSILVALLKKAKNLNITMFDSEYVTDLLVKDNKCFGAISFNVITAEITVHYSDAVILCTGGHTRIWERSTSRKLENHGDGYSLALKAGCKLIDMEMVQFHPTGILFPEEISGALVTEAVRGEGGILLNSNGERYMKNYDFERMELSTRDRVAMANYTEIKDGRGTPNGGVYLDISHKSKDFILEKLPKIYKQFIDNQMIDISKEPMEVAPTAHYSMGGIKVDCNGCSEVEGLYAAGEVMGGLHGANRLGGNSLAEILVFGKLVGSSASKYSRKLNVIRRSPEIVATHISKFQERIKKGKESAILIQNELRAIMWKYCGVVKDEESLKIGLKKINNLKKSLVDIEVVINHHNNQDLVNIFDLEASLQTAESTLISALERKESRGAHQRSDYPEIDYKEEINYAVFLKNDKLILESISHKKIDPQLKDLINNREEYDLTGRLLE